MIVDFFRALKEDVESGKVKVAWAAMGLTIAKRILGGYGIASDSLIEVLRKKGVLLGNTKTEITIAGGSVGSSRRVRKPPHDPLHQPLPPRL